MSLLNNSNAISTGGGYNLENSLRFRSSASAYLERTPATAGNRRTWTWSAWVKVNATQTDNLLFVGGGATTAGTGTNTRISWEEAKFNFSTDNTSGGSVRSLAVLRDPSAWYHLVCAVDTTQAISTDRVKLYINGEVVTSFDRTTYPALNRELGVNDTTVQVIGKYSSASSGYFDGYQTEINLIDGQALTASDFGETNATTGVWQPIEYTGTYGTNGFYLPFTPTSEATYSGDFTGSNYLYLSNPTELTLGTGDFTIETWVKFDNVTTLQSVYDSRPNGINGNYPFINLLTNGTLVWTVNTVTRIISSPLIADNWYHVAVARSEFKQALLIQTLLIIF
jgi:hypothetical protein